MGRADFVLSSKAMRLQACLAAKNKKLATQVSLSVLPTIRFWCCTALRSSSNLVLGSRSQLLMQSGSPPVTTQLLSHPVVVQAVLRWVEADPEGRTQEEVQQLLGAVRLPHPALAAGIAAATHASARPSH